MKRQGNARQLFTFSVLAWLIWRKPKSQFKLGTVVISMWILALAVRRPLKDRGIWCQQMQKLGEQLLKNTEASKTKPKKRELYRVRVLQSVQVLANSKKFHDCCHTTLLKQWECSLSQSVIQQNCEHLNKKTPLKSQIDTPQLLFSGVLCLLDAAVASAFFPRQTVGRQLTSYKAFTFQRIAACLHLLFFANCIGSPSFFRIAFSLCFGHLFVNQWCDTTTLRPHAEDKGTLNCWV